MGTKPHEMTPIIAAAIGLLAGSGAGYFLFLRVLTGKSDSIVRDAELRGEAIKEKKILQAKEKFIELKEKQANQRKDLDRKLNEREDRIKRTEQNLQRTIDQNKNAERKLSKDQEKLDQRLKAIEKKQKDLEVDHNKAIEALEKLSGMTAAEAKDAMVEQIKGEARAMAASQAQDIIDEAKEHANSEAKKIVIQTIQRVATEHSVENSVSVFQIKNDDIKGRIIGREGRNIRALEAATGVEFIVDDTPEAIILSCFDPVRREIARLSMHQLVTDGRIHGRTNGWMTRRDDERIGE